MLRFLKGFFTKPTPPEAMPATVVPYKIETPAVVEVAPVSAPIVEPVTPKAVPKAKAPAKAPPKKPAVAAKTPAKSRASRKPNAK